MGLLALAFCACSSTKKADEVVESDVPYPADEDMAYYQAQSDSGYQRFWTDIKATSSAFVNNSQYFDRGIRFEDIRIVGEGLYNGRVDINLGNGLLQLTLIRKFKAQGKNAIWQVVAAKEIRWRKSDSKSAK